MHLHIISFEIPYPANYGGAIDVFYSIMELRNAGVEITLHCFHKNTRPAQPILNELCREVHYYRRDTSLAAALRLTPYCVASRTSEQLISNLLQDDDPILFETLSTTFCMDDPRLKNRIKIFRESNVEHDYYRGLAAAERRWHKKLFYLTEAWKCERYEPKVSHAQSMAVVSLTDLSHFSTRYPSTPCHFIPSFHEDPAVRTRTGMGNYALYHGNLMVSENENAVRHICTRLAPLIPQVEIIIAGLNPARHLVRLIEQTPNARLIASPDQHDMEELIENAQVHILLTFQSTGIKLKLLNTLFEGRHIVANRKMTEGTGLETLCHVSDDPEQQAQTILSLMRTPFEQSDIDARAKALEDYSNTTQARKLIGLLRAK